MAPSQSTLRVEKSSVKFGILFGPLAYRNGRRAEAPLQAIGIHYRLPKITESAFPIGVFRVDES